MVAYKTSCSANESCFHFFSPIAKNFFLKKFFDEKMVIFE